ncbi:MAG: peroxiredoxin [Pseudomonadota bacterium]
MITSLSELPTNLPVPTDDGAALHLRDCVLPDVALPATNGTTVNLRMLRGRWVIYVYPMTGQPGVPLPDSWDEIPGARGCTPQSCGFRDHYTELKLLHTGVLGLSSQMTEYQREAKARLHLPFQLLSDSTMQLQNALRLPTFSVAGMTLFKRLTIIVENGFVKKVFYPVFPPDRNADDVVAWLKDAPRVATLPTY